MAQVLGNPRDQAAADAVEVGVDLLIPHDWHLLSHLLRRLPTQLHIVGRAVLVLGRCDLGLCCDGDGTQGRRNGHQRGISENSRHLTPPSSALTGSLRLDIAGSVPISTDELAANPGACYAACISQRPHLHPMPLPEHLFKSFWMAGFESACHINRKGVRLDMIAATQHDRFVDEDYARLTQVDIRAVRETVRWHLVD